MNPLVEKQILQATCASKITSTELIQKLWNNYGDLLRVQLEGGRSVILKHIKIPHEHAHPKGFNSDISRERKIKSYQVETNWYENFNHLNLQDQRSPTARLLKGFQSDGEFFLLLEDLNQTGFSQRLSSVNFDQVKVILKWLAAFHAKFLTMAPKGLWKTGTYWHLETRPDELAKLDDLTLQRVAPLIDQELQTTKYQTIVHGDAKLANFCFSENTDKVAAVDFQYVGGGCGMKDVAYFIGSCLDEEQSEELETEILDFYFENLKKNIQKPKIDKNELETEWRSLYHSAWADFHRFLKGWSPGHWKINSYSEKVTQSVTSSITNELLEVAKEACLQAGSIVKSHWQKEFDIQSKEASTLAARIVTEVDHLSQKKILQILQASLEKYDLGLLAEESHDDQSRLSKNLFWSVDPLDGTLYFSEGKSGFAIAISLVEKTGEPLIGVVYDPLDDNFYHAVRDRGAFCNGQPLRGKNNQGTLPLFADRSLQKAANFAVLEKSFDIHFTGGAVLNSINALLQGGCYFKYPKQETGGCAIWDLAAPALILQEAGGVMTGFDGLTLYFNKPDSLYYNLEGLMVCGSTEILGEVKRKLSPET